MVSAPSLSLENSSPLLCKLCLNLMVEMLGQTDKLGFNEHHSALGRSGSGMLQHQWNEMDAKSLDGRLGRCHLPDVVVQPPDPNKFRGLFM